MFLSFRITSFILFIAILFADNSTTILSDNSTTILSDNSTILSDNSTIIKIVLYKPSFRPSFRPSFQPSFLPIQAFQEESHPANSTMQPTRHKPRTDSTIVIVICVIIGCIILCWFMNEFCDFKSD